MAEQDVNGVYMKTFLAIYMGTDESTQKKWLQLDEKTRQEKEIAGMKAWGEWGAKHGASFVDQGTPLGTTKRIDEKGVVDIKNGLTGYVIVKAESHEAAAQMFLGHPHFSIFPGDSVEIMECLPLPPS